MFNEFVSDDRKKGKRDWPGKDPDGKYLARCQKELESWDAPISGWTCTHVYDVREDDYDAPLAKCDLCGCENVRYVHVMEHELFYEPVEVGCICAGIMEGDILRAKKRERLLKNRSARKRNFIKKEWNQKGDHTWMRRYRNQALMISKLGDSYVVCVGNERTTQYKGKPIRDRLSAVYAAFELADPVSEAMV